MNLRPRSLVPLVLALAASGCVTAGTYNTKVSELEKLRAQHDQEAALREKGLKAQIADLTSQRQNLEKQLEETRKQLDDTTALAGELKKRLEKLGQNVDKLTS